MTENYMVVELPKENEMSNTWLNEPGVFNDFNQAFDALNEKLSEEGQQLFKRPRLNVPMRIALKDRIIELWVIRRQQTFTTF